MNVLLLKVDSVVENVCIDLFRRFTFKASDSELNQYVSGHLEFLDTVLQHADPSYQTNKNIQICLVILNKVLGNEREFNPDELRFLNHLKNSKDIDVL